MFFGIGTGSYNPYLFELLLMYLFNTPSIEQLKKST